MRVQQAHYHLRRLPISTGLKDALIKRGQGKAGQTEGNTFPFVSTPQLSEAGVHLTAHTRKTHLNLTPGRSARLLHLSLGASGSKADSARPFHLPELKQAEPLQLPLPTLRVL